MQNVVEVFFDNALDAEVDIVLLARLDHVFSMDLANFPNVELTIVKERYIGLRDAVPWLRSTL